MIKKLGFCLILFFCLFSFSCNAPSGSNPSSQVEGGSNGAVIQAGDFSPGQLEAHYLKHGYQFGSISQDQYLENARALLNAQVGGDVYAKTRVNGDILRYRASTGEFAVMDKSGRIRTYFKTDYRYWMRQ
jgi:hypothetical protein